MKYDFNQIIWIQDMVRKLTSLMIWTLRIAKSIFSLAGNMNSSWRIYSSWAPSPHSNSKAHIWTTWFQKNVLINFNCSSKHNLISENSDHTPQYVTPRNWNGNTHGWFGFRLSEVVWHVDAVVGTGGLVVAGGLVEAGELEGSG